MDLVDYPHILLKDFILSCVGIFSIAMYVCLRELLFLCNNFSYNFIFVSSYYTLLPDK